MLRESRFGRLQMAVLVVIALIMGANLISPAVGHVTRKLKHLTKHLDPRYYNVGEKVGDADTLDGLNSNAFLGANAQAADSHLLDGLDSSFFAPSEAEALREVGAPGQPPFNDSGFCSWGNFAPDHALATFYKDPWGVVHLQGLVKAMDVPGEVCDFSFAEDQLIFTLPEGYRPARRSVYVVISDSAVGRVNIDPNGGVSVDTPITEDNARAWVSIQGLTFRAEAPLFRANNIMEGLRSPEPSRDR